MLAPNTDYTLGPRPGWLGRWDGCVLQSGSVNASRVVTSGLAACIDPVRTGAGCDGTPDRRELEGQRRTSKSMISKSAPKAAVARHAQSGSDCQAHLLQDFSSPTLDKNKWLIANKAWGGGGGVVGKRLHSQWGRKAAGQR
jgi:hypothetical protein